jgi:uncharacterized UPF0146 family protein
MGYITALAGPNYVETLLLPTIGAVTRTIAAQYNVDEIYSARRKEVEKRIMDVAAAALHDLIIETDDPDVVLQDLWFRSIRLPPTLQNAIESKLTQAQIAEQYVYILQREEREKERKIIEAEGIKSFQDIISSGISENYLRWKGIDATLRLAESTNSKIVIIGGKEGLPIILGPMENSAPSSGLPVPITTPPAQPNTGPPRPVQPRPGETATDPAKLLQDMQRLLPPIALDPRYALPVPPIDVIVPKRRDNSGG